MGDTALASACAAGPSGRVYAIEAHARTYKFLVENILLNESLCIVPICSAVGSHRGVARMSDRRHDDMNRIGEGSLSVQVNQLDSLVPSQRPYALVKIDVEGYEKFVLEGAGGVLSRTDCAYIEVADEHFAHFGYTTSDVIDVLCQYGFQCCRFTSANALERLPRDFRASRCENIVAIRSVSDFYQRTGWHVS